MQPSLTRASIPFCALVTIGATLVSVGDVPPSFAQVPPPKAVNTRIVETTRLPHDLGTRTTQVTEPLTNVTTTSITGGMRPGGGTNLFHSFDFFTVGSKDIAHFQNDMMLPTANIIARVIGDALGLREASTIDGILRTNNPLNAADPLNFGSANLYLVNPAGLIFGLDAVLDIKGSFAATTADYLRFNDGGMFRTEPAQPSVLTVGNVAAFGFTNPKPVAISIDQSNLLVSVGQSMSFVGGDLSIAHNFSLGGAVRQLRAPGGRIDLAAVGSAGEVVLNSPGEPPNLIVDSFTKMGTMTGTNASVDVRGANLFADPAGTIMVRGGDMTFRNSGFNAVGNPGGKLDVAGNSFSMLSGTTPFAGEGSIAVRTTGDVDHPGTALAIRLLGDLVMTNTSVLVDNFAAGRGGDTTITARNITLGTDSSSFGRIAADSQESGRSGSISLTASESLVVKNGFRVSARATGSGPAGDVVIRAKSVDLQGGKIESAALVNLNTNNPVTASGGTIDIQADRVEVSAGTNPSLCQIACGGEITTQAQGSGNGGTIKIVADSLVVDELSSINSFITNGIGGIGASGTSGTGGAIAINARTVTLDKGSIAADVSGGGPGAKGGSIRINSDDLTITNGASITASLDQNATGNAGSIDLRVNNLLSLSNGGAIKASTAGDGNGGTIAIQADQVRLTGAGSTITAETLRPFADLTVSFDILQFPDLDLSAFLVSPSGKITQLFFNVGGFGENFIGTTLSDQAAQSIAAGEAPFTGTFKPLGPLARFIGERANGTWTLKIDDTFPFFFDPVGSVESWSLKLGNQTFTALDLPKPIEQNGVTVESSLVVSGAPPLINGIGEAKGNGGDVIVNANTVTVQDGATLSATSRGLGKGGTLTVNAMDAVVLSGTGSGLFTEAEATGAGGNINVTAPRMTVGNGATVSAKTSGTGNAGNITLNGGTLSISDGAAINATTSGSGAGGAITINATGPVSLGDNSSITAASTALQNPGAGGDISIMTTGSFTSDHGSIVASAERAAGGSITIDSDSSINLNNSHISASVNGGDQPGGNITLKAPAVTVNGGVVQGGGSVEAITRGAGPGGSVLVDTARLSQNDSDINTSSFGSGRGGTVTVTATESISLVGSSIESVANSGGDAGQITVTTPLLTMSPGPRFDSSIDAFTFSSGNAGNITLNVQTATLQDSSIQVAAQPQSSGRGGNIVLQGLGGPGTRADRLELRNSQGGTSFISAATFGTGNAGSLSVFADNILMQGGGVGFVGLTTQVAAQASGPANAGNLRVDAKALEIRDGAQISAALFAGSGKGGSIDVTADTILISGRRQDGSPAGIFASNIFPSRGTPGNIRITSNDLTVQNFGQVSTFSNTFGDAGGIDIRTGNLTVTNGSFVTSTNFGAGVGGNVTVDAEHILLKGPTVPPQAFTPPSIAAIGGIPSQGAGNVTIRTSTLDILDGAQILARTNGRGAGGTIDVTADRITISGEDPNQFTPEGTASGIYAGTRVFGTAVAQATGPGGNINIRTGSLDLSNKGTIEALSDSAGNAGSVNITTNTLNMSGEASITTEARRQGNAGSVTINTNQLSMLSGSQITSSSFSTQPNAGSAGNITIQGQQGTGTDSLLVSGANSLISTTTAGAGQGGNIQIAAKQTQIEQLGRITADTTGKGKAGNVTLTGESVTIASGGRIEASTSSEGAGGSINVTTTGDVTISGVSSDGQTRSGIFAKTQTASGGGGGGGGGGSGGSVTRPGNAGDITISSRNLLLAAGAQIDSSTTSGGAGGSIAIHAGENITVTGSGTRLTSDATRGNGTGGSIELVAKTITVKDSGSVTAATGGTGDAGNISLTAFDQLLLQSAGTVTTSTSGSGKGGTIVIEAGRVLLDGAGTAITADTLRPFADMTITLNILHPNDGDLVVQLDSPTGTRVALLSRVGGSGDNFTNTSFNDQAAGGIAGGAPFTGTFTPREPLAQLISELVAGNWTLNVRDQATGNVGSLESWTLQIGAQTFQSTGGSRAIPDNGNVRSTIAVANPTVPTVPGTGEAPGLGGDVTVNARTVTVQNGATMSATTRGSGQGGTLTVNAGGPVALTGSGSGLFTDAAASGAGGNINVTASRMALDNGATVSAKSSGTGDAGTITINAGSEFLSTNGSITTEATRASGGNISLFATDTIRLRDSTISASVFGGPTTAGGNIFIDPQFIILQNSQIIAQAVQGAGGNINLAFSQAFLADASSTVSASSQFGVSGTVNFNSPVQNLSGALVPLKQSFLSGNVLLSQRCAAKVADASLSTFVVTEHEGLPQEPGGMLSSPFTEEMETLASGAPEPAIVVSGGRLLFGAPVWMAGEKSMADQSCRLQ